MKVFELMAILAAYNPDLSVVMTVPLEGGGTRTSPDFLITLSAGEVEPVQFKEDAVLTHRRLELRWTAGTTR